MTSLVVHGVIEVVVIEDELVTLLTGSQHVGSGLEVVELSAVLDGIVKEQSDIYNYTRLPQILTSVNENVEYDLYLDDYGYVRASVSTSL